jgi:hypothetical protein
MPHERMTGVNYSNASRPECAMVFEILVPHVWTCGRGLTRLAQSLQLEYSISAPDLEAVW